MLVGREDNATNPKYMNSLKDYEYLECKKQITKLSFEITLIDK